MNKIYLGLGSNIGDTRENISKALDILSKKIHITKISSLYKTEPVGYKEQDWFLNMVIEGETVLKPRELLDFTQSVEKEMKRVKTIRFGPRIIDVDILLYENINIQSDDLTIPHPRMKERAFVLIPLYEITKDIIIGDKKIKDLVYKLQGEKIIKIED
jgi:2-amino-4-hydroxy-6-hydroxymethyldihydropteridine diphosphokinase